MKEFIYFLAALLLIASSGQAQQLPGNSAADSTNTLDSLQQALVPQNHTELYPVLNGMRTSDNLVAAVGYLDGRKLRSTPATFINTGFTGRIAGLFTRQSSGEPGADGVSLSLRGRSPLIIVDNVPRTLPPWSINPEQIESVTVLKDALSTAMLGIRGMNGAILITTRKGERGPGFEMDLTAQGGLSRPVELPDPLQAYDYARLYNEALLNDGQSPIYSQSDLDAYRNNSDPFTHPNINWYDHILDDQTPFSRYTLNAEGTGKSVHYFVSLDYLNQDGLFRDFGENTYSTNSEYQRYIFRSNVNVDLSPRLSMDANLFGRIRDANEPGGGTANIFNSLMVTPGNAYPVFNPDSSLGGNINYSDNIYGQSVRSGYTNNVYSDGYVDLGLRREMDDLLSGWWVRGNVSYILTLNQSINRQKNFETFQLLTDPGTGAISYRRFGTKSEQNNSSTVSARRHQVYAQASTGYTRHLGMDKLDVLLLYNIDHNTINDDLAEKYETLGATVQYNIKDRYLLQAATSYSGNSSYAPGHGYGFFPSAGVAWNIHKESFFDSDFIDALKLRASYGLTGNAVAGYFEYIDRYAGGRNYYFGTSAASQPGIIEYQGRNITTWEKARKLDIGVDLRFAGERGALTIDYYRNTLTDLVQSRGSSAALSGYGFNIIQNLGENLYSGLEIIAGWADRSGDFGYAVSGNLSVSDSEIIFNDEPAYPYEWMQRSGRPVGQYYGYVSDGFINQTGEGPVVEGYEAVPGDLRYKDLNGDGMINQFDQRAIGNQRPLLFYGVDLGFSWRNFSLTLMIQGVANRDILLSGAAEWEFQNNGKGQAWKHHLGRWTPETASEATYPRLSVGTNVNNHVTSDFWLRPGSFVRLKNAEISYTFNDIALGRLQIGGLRIFINGLNLLTVSDFNQSDPEVLPGAYPLQRVFNGGLNIKF